MGKSTIFSAVTSAPAEAANYPFCTIEPNVGIVSLPDKRLDNLSALFHPKKTVPAIVEFVDIAGLVGGASKGEGLGNKFLSHIRQVGVIAHVVRCFDDKDIIHVSNKVDPASDIETINIELALADLETVEKRKVKTEKLLHAGKDAAKAAQAELEVLEMLNKALSDGKPARSERDDLVPFTGEKKGMGSLTSMPPRTQWWSLTCPHSSFLLTCPLLTARKSAAYTCMPTYTPALRSDQGDPGVLSL